MVFFKFFLLGLVMAFFIVLVVEIARKFFRLNPTHKQEFIIQKIDNGFWVTIKFRTFKSDYSLEFKAKDFDQAMNFLKENLLKGVEIDGKINLVIEKNENDEQPYAHLGLFYEPF